MTTKKVNDYKLKENKVEIKFKLEKVIRNPNSTQPCTNALQSQTILNPKTLIRSEGYSRVGAETASSRLGHSD
jgi:hypothetical protein